MIMATNNLNEIINTCTNDDIDFLIVDSIQTLYLETVNYLQGTTVKIKACTMELMKFANCME